jgi:hypothetical protein
MASLTGNTISSTYEGLLKFADNVGVNSTSKNITDGDGTATPLFLATSSIAVSGSVDITGSLTIVSAAGDTYALLEAESLVVSTNDDLVGTYTDIHGIQFYSGSNFIDITVNGIEFGDYVSGSLIAVSNSAGNPQAIVRFQNYSNWTDGTVSITAPLQAQTGSQVTGSLSISGSLKFATSSSFTFPTVQPASPVAGTAFFSGSRLYIYNGSAYVSASFS